MAVITRQALSLSGLEPVYTPCTQTGDTFKWYPNVFVHVKNDDASSHDVIIREQHDSAPPGFQAVDETVTIPDGSEHFIGPFDKEAFVNSGGYVEIGYSASIASMTIAVFELPTK
jgi:hypothetical protein